jgi:hypothetical protein
LTLEISKTIESYPEHNYSTVKLATVAIKPQPSQLAIVVAEAPLSSSGVALGKGDRVVVVRGVESALVNVLLDTGARVVKIIVDVVLIVAFMLEDVTNVDVILVVGTIDVEVVVSTNVLILVVEEDKLSVCGSGSGTAGGVVGAGSTGAASTGVDDGAGGA